MSSIETDIIINPENDSLNPFKPLFVKTVEDIITEENSKQPERLEKLSKQANTVLPTPLIQNKSIKQFSTDMSNSLLTLLDDLFNKPPNTPWPTYLQELLTKNNRMTYIGTLFIILSLFTALIG
jgi:hypothetical protein